jgi:hypothetical protein
MAIDAEHYAAIIAELDEEIAALMKTREVMVRKMVEAGGDATGLEIVPGMAKLTITGNLAASAQVHKELRSDSFFGLSASQAIIKYLSMVKRPAKPTELTEQLVAGGFTTKSDNVYSTIFTALTRNKDTIFSNLGRSKGWGLKAWYGSGGKAGNEG